MSIKKPTISRLRTTRSFRIWSVIVSFDWQLSVKRNPANKRAIFRNINVYGAIKITPAGVIKQRGPIEIHNVNPCGIISSLDETIISGYTMSFLRAFLSSSSSLMMVIHETRANSVCFISSLRPPPLLFRHLPLWLAFKWPLQFMAINLIGHFTHSSHNIWR